MPNLKFRTVLLRSARLLSDEFNEILLQHQLNYSLWQVLYLIQDQPEINANEIAKYLNVSKPSITKRVHSLMHLELIQALDGVDKRAKNLSLTKKGLLMFKTCSEQIDSYEKTLLSSFTPHALEQSFDTLNQLLNRLQHPETSRNNINAELENTHD